MDNVNVPGFITLYLLKHKILIIFFTQVFVNFVFHSFSNHENTEKMSTSTQTASILKTKIKISV